MHRLPLLFSLTAALSLFGFVDNASATTPLKTEADKQFQKLLTARTMAQWGPLMDANISRLPKGHIVVNFRVSHDQHISDIRVTPAQKDDLLTQLTSDALHRVEVPPIPADLGLGPLELKMTFEVFN